jgi:hypothetical protein
MSLFRPIDETSLRHLFSTGYAQEILRLSYVRRENVGRVHRGGVSNERGNVGRRREMHDA